MLSSKSHAISRRAKVVPQVRAVFYKATLRFGVTVVHRGNTILFQPRQHGEFWVLIVTLKPGHSVGHKDPWDTSDDLEAVLSEEGALNGI